MNIENRQKLIKKLLYLSNHRGCKETDIILGRFAKENIDKMNNQELLEFAAILNLPDGDIYDWYTKKHPLPSELSSKLIKQILQFDPNKN